MTDEVKNEVEVTEEVVAETEEQPQPSYIEQIAAKMSKEVQYNNFYKKKDEITEDALGTMPALPADTDNAATQNAHKKNAPGEKKLSDAGLEVPGEEKGGAGQSTARKADKSGGDTTTKAAVQQDPDNKKAYDAMGVKLGEAKDIDADNTEKALKHDCATHVVHKEHGEGRCVPGMHTLEENEDGTGYVTHYDVMFDGEEGPYIVENCPVEDLEVIKEKNHGHMKKKKVTEALAPGHAHKDDKTYAADDEADDDHQLDYANHQAKVVSHAKKQGYKVNHDGNNHKHKRPDITMHTAMGDHDPHGYTVHKNGSAHKDKVLHAPKHIVHDF